MFYLHFWSFQSWGYNLSRAILFYVPNDSQGHLRTLNKEFAMVLLFYLHFSSMQGSDRVFYFHTSSANQMASFEHVTWNIEYSEPQRNYHHACWLIMLGGIMFYHQLLSEPYCSITDIQSEHTSISHLHISITSLRPTPQHLNSP